MSQVAKLVGMQECDFTNENGRNKGLNLFFYFEDDFDGIEGHPVEKIWNPYDFDKNEYKYSMPDDMVVGNCYEFKHEVSGYGKQKTKIVLKGFELVGKSKQSPKGPLPQM